VIGAVLLVFGSKQLAVALGLAYSGLHLAEIRRILSHSAVSEERSELTCVIATASLSIVGGARHRRTTSELVSSSLRAFASCREPAVLQAIKANKAVHVVSSCQVAHGFIPSRWRFMRVAGLGQLVRSRWVTD
jgi:hypothetical protein